MENYDIKGVRARTMEGTRQVRASMEDLMRLLALSGTNIKRERHIVAARISREVLKKCHDLSNFLSRRTYSLFWRLY